MCVSFVLSLSPSQWVKPFPPRERGEMMGAIHVTYMGTKAFGDSWPNVVIVGDKEMWK